LLRDGFIVNLTQHQRVLDGQTDRQTNEVYISIALNSTVNMECVR